MGKRHQIKSVLTAGCILGALVSAAVAERIISEGDTWRFRNGWSYVYPGTNWTTLAYDDNTNGWFSLTSGFGYGDGDDGTVLNDMQNTGTTFYTRKKFVLDSPAALNYLTLGVDYDDGFVAWINGVEVARRNVNGAVTNTTVAAGNHEASRGNGVDNPNEKEFIAVTNNLATLLVAGTNVIAVSGHNISLSSSDASLIVELYTNVTLVRGPFIQMPDTNAVTVVWRTDALTDSAVDYGLDLTYSGGTVSDSTLTNQHVINIPNLLPNTNYYYRIRSSGVTLREGDLFRTRRTADKPFKFAIIGDFGQGTSGMSNVAARVNLTDFDLFLTVGDNLYPDGQPGFYDPYWFKLYEATMRRVPTMPVLGNHDIISANGQWLVDYFILPTNGPADYIERNYSYDYGNVHFVAVDSNPFDLNQTAAINAIKTWLSNDLASTTQPWKFVYLHHPAYSSGRENAGVKAHVIPIIDNAGVDVVFFGHDHYYERINAFNGVHHIVTGDAGASLSSPTPKLSSAKLVSVHGFTLVEMTGSRMKLTQLDTSGALLDEFDLDNRHSFRIDGLLDAGASNAWLRAQNGLKLYAAIKSNYLYVATQDAGEGSDHFIYLNNVLSTNRPANWTKAGQVMQWSAFLADENNSGFHGWFGDNEQMLTNFPTYQSMTSGTNNNAPFSNGALEGTINLNTHFGVWPQQIYLAAAPYGTANGGALVASALVSNVNGNANIESNEFVMLNTRDIALDLPIAIAGPNQTNEAGMVVLLNGLSSFAPSGLPISYDWTQTVGPPVTLVNSNNPVASFVTNGNVVASADLTFKLVVGDTRFTSNSFTMVTLTSMVDSDGDGLSDAEEETGQDNVLTAPNPNGYMTDKTKADTDGDGSSDGQEAIAKTDPNDSGSVFRIIQVTPAPGGGFVIEWNCVPGNTYRPQYRDDMTNSWSNLSGDITATTTATATNATDATASGEAKRFYRVIIP